MQQYVIYIYEKHLVDKKTFFLIFLLPNSPMTGMQLTLFTLPSHAEDNVILKSLYRETYRSLRVFLHTRLSASARVKMHLLWGEIRRITGW